KVSAAERRVVVVVDQESYVAQPQRACYARQQHQHDRHQHCQQNEQLVAAKQREFLPSLGQDFLHSGISDLRDSMSEINTSSTETPTRFPKTIPTPPPLNAPPAARFSSSFCTTTCMRSPNSETRDGPNFFLSTASARSGWSTSIS